MTVRRGYFFCGSLSYKFLLCFRARLFFDGLWLPARKGLTSWLSFVVSSVSLSLPIGILGQVWYLIVSIPDLCTITYFFFYYAIRAVIVLSGLLLCYVDCDYAMWAVIVLSGLLLCYVDSDCAMWASIMLCGQ